MAVVVETIYKVGDFTFNNQKDADKFDNYLNVLEDKQLKELYYGYESKIDYTIYA